MGKLCFGTKTSSEMKQYKDIVSIQCLYKVAYGLASGTG